ncbi:MAG: alpha/beta hydrolase [Saprospiraceae bacterium]
MNRILLFLILIALTSCGKEALEVLPENILEIESAHTGEAYEIQVLLPANYDESREYKVAYMLDGYYHFDYMRNEFTKQSYLEDVIFVGIFYRDYPLPIARGSENESISTLIENSGEIGRLRTMDFMYPENLDGSGGGGLLFYEFLKTELIPLIDQTYSTDADNRTIMGHSFGAYFVMFQMFEFVNEPLFQNIICLDNQYWWADLYLMEKATEVFENEVNLPFKLYMGAAKFANFDTNSLINEFVERLETANPDGLDYKFERYNDGHSYSAKNGFQLGLKYIFNE